MISLPLEQWDELDVGCWLLSNGGFFVRLVEPFRYNTIDGSLLYEMNEQTLRTLYKLNHHECEIFLRRLREVIGFRKEILASQVEFRFCDGKNQASVSDVGNWDYEEVCMWLLRTGGSKLKLIEKFYLNQVNGAELLSLTKDDLSAYGFPECDQKSFLLRRQDIAENGFNFKESWNKLFVRPMGDELIGLEGHISETHSSALSSESSEADLSSSPELLPLSPESLLSFSFNEHSISEETAESSIDLLPVLKHVPKFGTERPDIVLGAIENVAVETDRKASFSTNERRTADGPDIILGSIKMPESELVKAQPDGETDFSDVDLKDTSTDVVLYEPREAGRETDGVDIVLGPISMNESVIGENEFALNFPGQVHIEGETNEPGNQFGVVNYSYQDNLRDTFQELHDATNYQNAWGKQNVARLKRLQIPCRMKRQPSLGSEGATHEYQPQQDEQEFGPMNLLEPNNQSFSERIQQKVGTHQFREHQVSEIQEARQGEGPNLKLQNVELIQIFQLSPERERQNAHVMHQNVLQALNQNDENKSQMIQHDTSQTFQGLQSIRPHFLQAENSYGQNKRVFIYVKDFDHAVPLEGRQDVEECAGYLLTSQLAILPTVSLLLQYSTTLLHIQTLSFMILHSTMLAAVYMRLLRFEPAKPALVMRNHHQPTCERRKLPSIICRSTSMCVL